MFISEDMHFYTLHIRILYGNKTIWQSGSANLKCSNTSTHHGFVSSFAQVPQNPVLNIGLYSSGFKKHMHTNESYDISLLECNYQIFGSEVFFKQEQIFNLLLIILYCFQRRDFIQYSFMVYYFYCYIWLHSIKQQQILYQSVNPVF